jgi:AtzE family amidohydrolase
MSTDAEALLRRVAPAVVEGAAWEHLDPGLLFDPGWEPAGPAPDRGLWGPSISEPSAVAATEAALSAATALAPLNLYTEVFADSARAAAQAVDAGAAQALPLRGVTVAVKNLFDVAGHVTLAGAAQRAADPPATRDATVVARLRAAGAVVIGATNMDELAYGFTTENSHYGVTHNPHDTSRIAGGSSGGSAAAVAAGAVRVAIGTDTNGSVRIPAAFCGVFGLRPTLGALPRTGSVLFAASLDTIGPLARTVLDLAAVMDVLAGPDGEDRSCSRPQSGNLVSVLDSGLDGLRIARAGADLWKGATSEILEAVETVADALGASAVVEVPEVNHARAAAVTITAAEGADQHQRLLRSAPDLFDARVRDRFLAGLTVPATDYLAAQRFRSWWRGEVARALNNVDVLVLPATPCSAPLINQALIEIDGVTLPTGAVLGRFTQPLGLVGLPAMTVPVAAGRSLPTAAQLVGRPGGEAALFRAAAVLETAGIAAFRTPNLVADSM